MTGYRSKSLNPSGLRSIVFTPDKALSSAYEDQIQLPCGTCLHCQLQYSQGWATRVMNEASQYDSNCFITLTYADQNLPPLASLSPSHPVAFMKALRQKLGSNIRSFGCAEYGEKLSRPHYHLCLFNINFSDKKHFSNSPTGHKLYISQTLNSLWPHGFSNIGELNYQTAAYVARYVTKKINGDKKDAHYGERLPERSICISRRPGIGRNWYDKYKQQLINHDYIIIQGKKQKIPKYYDRLLSIDFPDEMEEIKRTRKLVGESSNAKLMAEDSAAMKNFRDYHDQEIDAFLPEHRLTVIEKIHVMKTNLLKRTI